MPTCTSCLDNIIGIRGLCSDTENQGCLWLNDLPGITIANANAAINSEQESGFALLQQKKVLAIETVKANARAFFANKMRLDSLIDSDVLGRYDQDMPTEAAAATYKGIQIRSDNYHHAELIISSIRLQAQATGTVTVKVFDLLTGKEVDSIDIACIANEITEKVVNLVYKPFNKRFNLLFAYDATAVAAYETKAYYGRAACCGAFSGYYQCGCSPYYLSTRAASIGLATQKINTNITAATSTGGLSLTYSMVCSIEPLLCQVAPAIALPLLHKWGQLAMEEFVYSKRLNSVITLNKENHKELWGLYEQRYSESMSQFFENMLLPKDPCYNCSPKVRATTVVP